MTDTIDVIGDELHMGPWHVGNLLPVPASVRADAEEAISRARDGLIADLQWEIARLTATNKELRADLKAAKKKKVEA